MRQNLWTDMWASMLKQMWSIISITHVWNNRMQWKRWHRRKYCFHWWIWWLRNVGRIWLHESNVILSVLCITGILWTISVLPIHGKKLLSILSKEDVRLFLKILQWWQRGSCFRDWKYLLLMLTTSYKFNTYIHWCQYRHWICKIMEWYENLWIIDISHSPYLSRDVYHPGCNASMIHWISFTHRMVPA